MTELEYQALVAQGFDRIPLMAQSFADLETPLSLYLKLAHSAGGAQSFLLESVVGGERFGRYSFIGLPARTFIRANGNLTEVVTDGQVVQTHTGDPLQFVQEFTQKIKVATRPGLPRFCGGLAGYFAYDVVRHIETKLGANVKPDPQNLPDILLLLCQELAIIDNISGRLYLIVYADAKNPEGYSQGQSRLKELLTRLKRPAEAPYSQASMQTQARRNFEKQDYLNAVVQAKELIAAGDLMQVQIGQVISKPFRDSPLTLYRALRSLNPSPYMYYYNFGDFQVVGASPEILVRQEQTPDGIEVTVRPLAGTRKRGATPEQDLALEAELLADPKERAEHVMLIDLARNDIGRIAKIGSVKVTEQMVVERYSHVMHIVSNVKGLLKDGMTNMDVLRATFPAGTLTGAPKVRAMQLIDQLEPVKRGLYGGAAGYISFSGEMDLAIAIRTGVIKDGMLHVQAAAGVVADSIPEAEHAETEAKARALLRAAELVQDGLE